MVKQVSVHFQYSNFHEVKINIYATYVTIFLWMLLDLINIQLIHWINDILMFTSGYKITFQFECSTRAISKTPNVLCTNYSVKCTNYVSCCHATALINSYIIIFIVVLIVACNNLHWKLKICLVRYGYCCLYFRSPCCCPYISMLFFVFSRLQFLTASQGSSKHDNYFDERMNPLDCSNLP